MSPRIVLLAGALLLAGCGASTRASGPTDSGGDGPAAPVRASDPQGTAGSTASTALVGAALVKTAPGPVGLTVDTQGRVWVANADDGTVSRINAAGDGVDVSTPVGAAPLRLAATPGAVWVTVFSDGTLVRLDDTTGRVTRTVRVGTEPEGLTAADGSLWVVLQASSELVRVDPQRGTVTHRYHLGVAPRLVTAGQHLLWVSDYGSGRVFRLDPASGDVRRSAALCFGPQGMLFTAGTLWVACTTDEVLVGVDTRTLKETARLSLPGAPDAVTAGPHGQVLVALQQGPTLAVVDPAGPSVVRRDRLGSMDQLHDRANIDVVYGAGKAWVSSYLEGGVYRVSP